MEEENPYKLSHQQLNQLDRIDELRREKRYEEALLLCKQMIAEDGNCFMAYSKRKNLYRTMGRYEEAFQDIDILLKLRPEKSPGSYYTRGEIKLEIGQYEDAINDFTFVINVQEYYFLNSAYFHRSFAYYKLGKKKKALEDCLQVPHDFCYWVKLNGEKKGQLYTKDSLLELITKMR